MSALPELREVTRASLRPLLKLEPGPEQRDRVAPAAVTIAEVHYEPGAWLRGLWLGPEAVGLMAMIDPRVDPDPDEPPAPPGAAYLWRLMIDHRFQGRGFGRHAVAAAQGMAERRGLPGLFLHALDKPGGGSIPFYEKLGFRRTGRMEGDEAELLRP